MQRHVRGLEIATASAIAAFALSIMLHHYMMAYATVVITFFVGGAYVVAVARFPNRMDPDDDRDVPKAAKPNRGPRPG